MTLMKAKTLDLRSHIAKLGFSNSGLARRMCVKRTAFEQWLSRGRVPDKYCDELCEILCLEPDKLQPGHSARIEYKRQNGSRAPLNFGVEAKK